ncbi:hypothetical protein BDR07DRAFT_1535488 [Suillus spraguei]|nr:hypothetical protein BDR07DRAFT_1535488 [Suillus spraguei]
MDVKDIDVLCNIHQVIEVPHMAQELLSSEQTPTLSMALPAYEVLKGQWTQLQSTIWELCYPTILVSVLINYSSTSTKEGKHAYMHFQFINPSIKLEWLKEHWEAEDIENAQEWILQAMTSFHMSIRVSNTQTGTLSVSQQVLTNSTAIALRSLSAGFGHMNNLKYSPSNSHHHYL